MDAQSTPLHHSRLLRNNSSLAHPPQLSIPPTVAALRGILFTLKNRPWCRFAVSIGLDEPGCYQPTTLFHRVPHRALVGLLGTLEDRLGLLPATQQAEILKWHVLQLGGKLATQTVPPTSPDV